MNTFSEKVYEKPVVEILSTVISGNILSIVNVFCGIFRKHRRYAYLPKQRIMTARIVGRVVRYELRNVGEIDQA